MAQLTPTELQVWLEWAGSRLIAMPGGRTAPTQVRVLWPDYAQDVWEITRFRGASSLRVSGPTSAEIPIMDEILLLPNVCEWINTRRVIHTRTLVHPVNGRYLYPWTRIAKLLQTSPEAVKRWYKRGLNEIVDKADPVVVCRIAAFVSEAEHSALRPLDRQVG